MKGASTSTLVLFSATVSAEELAVVLAEDRRQPGGHLALVGQHLGLRHESLQTLPELGYAEVVTADVELADALEFLDAEVIDLQSGTKQVLVRAAGGAWQLAGVMRCGPSEELVPQLLQDVDLPAFTVLAGCEDMPHVWQWASCVVASAAPALALQLADAQRQEHQAPVAAAEVEVHRQQHDQQQEQQEQQQVQAPSHPAVLAARAQALLCSAPSARAASFTAGWGAVMRAASSFSTSALRPCAWLTRGRHMAHVSGPAMSPKGTHRRHESSSGTRSALVASEARSRSFHTCSLPLVSH